LLVTVTISYSLRNQYANNIYWEKTKANYAIESGIAFAQEKLKTDGFIEKEAQQRIEHFRVVVELLNETFTYLKVTAYGRFGVKQSIMIHLSPLTHEITRQDG
jgi:hypothetical protein